MQTFVLIHIQLLINKTHSNESINILNHFIDNFLLCFCIHERQLFPPNAQTNRFIQPSLTTMVSYQHWQNVLHPTTTDTSCYIPPLLTPFVTSHHHWHHLLHPTTTATSCYIPPLLTPVVTSHHYWHQLLLHATDAKWNYSCTQASTTVHHIHCFLPSRFKFQLIYLMPWLFISEK